MKQSTTKLIRFYKGIVLVELHKCICLKDDSISLSDLDLFLKWNAGFGLDFSCGDQDTTIDDVGELIAWSIQFGIDVLNIKIKGTDTL